MQPQFRVVVNGADITALINDRLLSLRTLDKPGMSSDEFELRLDDRDGALLLPRRGAGVAIYLGYVGKALTLMGRYTVDAVEFSGPPDTIVVRGGAGDARGSGKTVRSGSWEGVSLATIIKAVAARNGWTAACKVNTIVARIDQLGESDYHFVTRLARLYNCTAKLANGNLLVLPRQSGRTASGRALAPVTLRRGDLSRFQFRFEDKAAHAGVRARYQDQRSGQLKTLELANPDVPAGIPAVHADRHIHPSKSAAQQAMRGRLATFNRATAAVRLDMLGRTDLFVEREVALKGVKSGLDGGYLISAVEQMYTPAGWSTSVECNGGARGKAKVAGKKKKTKPARKTLVT